MIPPSCLCLHRTCHSIDEWFKPEIAIKKLKCIIINVYIISIIATIDKAYITDLRYIDPKAYAMRSRKVIRINHTSIVIVSIKSRTTIEDSIWRANNGVSECLTDDISTHCSRI